MIEYDIAFARLGQFLPFLHIASAAVFIGLQLGLLIFGRYLLSNRCKSTDKVFLTIRFLRQFGIFLIISLFVIAASSFLFSNQDASLRSADPMATAILATKWTLWLFLTLNLSYMFYHYKKALVALKIREKITLHESLVVIIIYFTPLNLIVSFIAVYLGVAYKDF
ncbi:3-isopropylmalate dehydratase [Campylobacter sp. RM9344]|uniref:3-isopropylmalate dehydratase n=1 Tax=Campylobacter californiensis TaxID=1032243 RepID=A0AAW3ZWT6_9BACT|nr:MULTISPECIES: 3-isopropylmalate dehydratase [unclassified Campylobacter]MBE2983963.1 3-isopropylmalate dehydratase [Campylobacter sp. RM6883]MBE2994501.1 3-isopropylmalate dehydratase [Campylobacter sp. RM6913]MBE3028809.1 3-isopropylmalate dehydratase [Campylobacter sp. RM9344]MBE3607698.1 3-isopropylmalate dehydratase [Campylobacter sp. RM9337]QCD51090.1 putative membrane protein [Campylobacter sp. RM6914]